RVYAVSRALLRRVNHLERQVGRHAGPHPGGLQQLTGGVLDVGKAVDVELEDLRRVLHAEAVTGAEILVDPDLQLVGFRPRTHLVPPHETSHPTVPEPTDN